MRKKTLAAGALIALAAAATAHALTQSGATVRGDDALRAAMLAGHNEARAAAGVAALVWDERLAYDAAGYAAELAADDAFAHSADRGAAAHEGENLWSGTPRAYSFDEMLGDWLAEARDFRPGVLPDVSATGQFADVAHYVQIIWPGTRRFGCAIAANDHAEYLVCRYAPRGNVWGRRLEPKAPN